MMVENELIYSISYFPDINEFYKLNGKNGEEYTFYRKTPKKWALSIGKYDLIHLTQTNMFDTKIKFEYLGYSKLRAVRYFIELNWNIRITGRYLGLGNIINWSWIKANDYSNAFILIDRDKRDQFMAKMVGLTIENKLNGSIYIAIGVHSDYVSTIITSACLVWRLMYECDDTTKS